ncbi:MAG: hypothetical protein ABIP66_06955 [Gemmatimonadaceae bacterium]
MAGKKKVAPSAVLGTGGVPNFRMNADYADTKAPVFSFELHAAIECQSKDEFETLKELVGDKGKDAESIKKVMQGKIKTGVDKNDLTTLLKTAFKLRKT